MLEIKSLNDDELWLLTCGIQELHDSLRHDPENYTEGIITLAEEMREKLEEETDLRKLDYRRWERET